MKAKLLTTVLCTLFVSGISLAVALAPQGSVYKLKEAGIQITVPAGWEVESDAKGVTLSKKEKEDSFAIASMATLDVNASASLEDTFKLAWQGALEGMKGDIKDLKLVGESAKATQNGI